MVYTIKIEDSNPKAKELFGLINQYREFINVEISTDSGISEYDHLVEEELIRRYELFETNQKSKTWSDLKAELV